MNKKGQTMVGVGGFIMLAIALIVGLILLQASAQNVGDVTNTVTLANVSIGNLGAEGASIYVTDYKAISSVVIYNATGTLVPAANYTVTNNVVYNGAEAVQITTGAVNAYANDSVNISGTAQPLTYANDSGSRSMSVLIIILMALALVATAVVYAVKGYQQ